MQALNLAYTFHALRHTHASRHIAKGMCAKKLKIGRALLPI